MSVWSQSRETDVWADTGTWKASRRVRSLSIAILTHEADTSFKTTNYLVHPLAERWKAMGLRVAVRRGKRSTVLADVLLPHIDLTIIPTDYCAVMQRYPRVVNRRVLDISKTAISANLVRPGSDYAGPVIVKTDRNHGGLPELRLAHRKRSLLGGLWGRHTLPRRMSSGPTDWRGVDWLDPLSYPVFRSLPEVPHEIFENPHLIVEKLVPEMDGDRYCVRYFYSLGSREFTLLLRSSNPVIKGPNVETWEEVEGHPAIRSLRSRLGLDYAKIDYVVRGGDAVVLDINRTPACSILDRLCLTEKVADRLAEGILNTVPE
jgi:hypothetical protein